MPKTKLNDPIFGTLDTVIYSDRPYNAMRSRFRGLKNKVLKRESKLFLDRTKHTS
jgi:hypothetical protein